MRNVTIAYVPGDGAAPEMMEAAWRVACEAAKIDNVVLEREEAPMGWAAFRTFGDTLPESSMATVRKHGIVFFGGVGEKRLDATFGVEHPKMKPESKCLLALRGELGLLLNIRPMVFMPELAGLSPLRNLPKHTVEQHWFRYLQEDTYFGNKDLRDELPPRIRERFGVKLVGEVAGNEPIITDLAYYKRETLLKYFLAAFRYAHELGLPLTCINKKNMVPRYVLWCAVCAQVAKKFPQVPLSYEYVDSACMFLFQPERFHGVVCAGNEHGDILTDGAAGAIGSMGMMHSASLNPDPTKKLALFESGAGTAEDWAGKDKANPLGRILTAAMMLRYLDAPRAASAIENAVQKVLRSGKRTFDLSLGSFNNICGCREMGSAVIKALQS